MSNFETEPSTPAEYPFSDIDAALKQFAMQVAEVETVFDYRLGGKRQLRAMLARECEANLYSGELVVIVPQPGAGRLVNHTSGVSLACEGPFVGYLEQFFPVPEIYEVADFSTPDDINYIPSASEEEPWLNRHNLVIPKLGLRVRPAIPHNGYEDDDLVYEVLAEDVLDLFEADDMHPLLGEEGIFNQMAATLLRGVGSGRVDLGQVSYRLTEAVFEQSQETQYKDAHLRFVLHPDAELFITDDLSSARAFITNEGKEDPVFPDRVELPTDTLHSFKLLGFDWLWVSDLESSDDNDVALFAVVELLDESDQELAGGARVACVAVDNFRLGDILEKRQTIQHPQDIFAYEKKLFNSSLEWLATQNGKLNQEDMMRAVQNILAAVNVVDEDGAQNLYTSRTLGSEIILNLEQYRVVRGWYLSDDQCYECTVNIRDFQDVRGIITEYVAGDISPDDESAELILRCVLDVRSDRELRSLGVDAIEVPVEEVSRAQLVTGLEVGKLGALLRSRYPHAN